MRAVSEVPTGVRDVDSHGQLRKPPPSLRGGAPRLLRKYPVTSFLLMPYLVLILPQAIIFRNPETLFIVSIMSVAVVPAFVVELFLTKAHSDFGDPGAIRYGRNLYRVAVFVGVVGALSTTLRAVAGVGSVYAQVGRGSGATFLTTALSVLTPWSVIAVGLLAAAYLAGSSTRREMFLWISLQLVAQGIAAGLNAITAPFFVFVIFVFVLLLYLNIIGIRTCAVVGAAILVAWPSIYAFRNEARLAGGVDVSSRVGAFDRLRYDLQITRAADIGFNIDIPTPDVIGILRYGLIPRFLDPGRPPLSTGSAINVYLGGGAESSFTFLPVTTAFVLEGYWVVALMYAGWAVALFLLLRHGRRLTPLRVAVLALVLAGPLSWFASYPDDLIGLLQGLVALAPVAVAMHLLRQRPPRRRTAPRLGGHR